ncbi:Sec-independent protein translocase protein TatB [Psychrobacter sp. FBL11]|uniref:Sec-independent protein translocase protein TatB n=1 Tax=Psychrobacter saeujeotis TaxID=3143436 RepID=A0ABU9XDL5_9GAMM|nr:Sec-independent protein translocase protein TatB [uncultured Psychrobacter sp.]
MFDIGFSELLLFGVIALIVLGPEKLPQAARTAGQWYAKLRRTVSTLQSEIEAELDLAETRKQMQDELAKIRQTEADMKREMAELRGSMQDFEYSQHQSMDAINNPNSYNSNDEPFEDDYDEHMMHMSEEGLFSDSDMPAEFAYDYEQDRLSNYSSDVSSSDPYKVTESVDGSFDQTANNTKDSLGASSNTPPRFITRPWEKMWFRLSDYDQSRRLPAPPYLPNYEADHLLHDDFSHSSFSHHDLDEKMPPIDEYWESEFDEDEFEQSERHASQNSSAHNTDQDGSTTPLSLSKREAPK